MNRPTDSVSPGSGPLRLPRLELPVERLQDVRLRARQRIRQVGTVFSLLLALAGLRGAMLCVWPGEETLRELIATRWYRKGIPARRGDILDRNGNRLATTVPTPDIVINPKLVAEMHPTRKYDIDVAARKLAELLGRTDAPAIAARMRLGVGDQYEPLAYAVDGATALAVQDLRYQGVEIHWTPRRYYPEQTIAGQILGYVGRDRGTGLEGLEAAFDEALRGESLYLLRRRKADAVGTPDVARGMDVRLTLDRTVQRIAERALQSAFDATLPQAAAAVVLDVRTGELLAVANAPAFNPNSYEKVPDAARRNYAFEASIEPGSVMKPFTVAAALEEGVVRPDEVIDCSALPGFPLLHDHEPFGALQVTDVIAKSSNIGAARIAQRLEPDEFVAYLHAFGFGRDLGVRVPLAARGEVYDPRQPDPTQLVNNAFGQGMTASPVQLAYALATLGNGGVRMRPALVSRVSDLHGVPDYVRNPTVAERVVSPQTAAELLRMMAAVMADGGTGHSVQVPGYAIAGKTGTAQKADGHGSYGAERIVSFMGLVPAEAPALAIVVTLDAPTVGKPSGGGMAGPVFVQIAAEALPYLGIPSAVPSAVEPPAPTEPCCFPARGSIELVWSGAGFAVPDLRGRPLRPVLDALAPSGVAVRATGSGLVARQEPPPGDIVRPGQEVSLVLQ